MPESTIFIVGETTEDQHETREDSTGRRRNIGKRNIRRDKGDLESYMRPEAFMRSMACEVGQLSDLCDPIRQTDENTAHRSYATTHTGKFTFSALPKTIPELLISVEK